MNPILYVVIPCYNEEEILPKSFATLRAKITQMIHNNLIAPASTLIFVDDGSQDKTWKILDSLSRNIAPKDFRHQKKIDTNGQMRYVSNTTESVQYLATQTKVFMPPPHEFLLSNPIKSCKDSLQELAPRVIALKLSANKGHQNALLAGLEYASGQCDCVISIDCDLQQDEQKFDIFIEKYNSGADIVIGIRNDRRSDTWLKRWTALGFYKLMALMGVKLTKNHADYRLLSSRALYALLAHKESNLFLRGIIDNLGFSKEYVFFDVKPRSAGQSKYPLHKMLSFAWNGITSFSIVPLRLVSMLGFTFCLLSVVFGGYALYIKLCTDNALWGWTSIIIPLSFFSGIQLLSLGIIGEYIGKIYTESKHRPRYFVQEILDSSLGNTLEDIDSSDLGNLF